MNETWKPVVGFESLYEVSNAGQVRRKTKYNNSSDRPLAASVVSGYLRVCLSKDNTRSNHLVHRLVANAFIGIPKGMSVNHRNGIKTDCRLSNLEVCSRRDNERHKWRDLRRGVRNNVKLTWEQVCEIRAAYPKIKSLRKLAGSYGVNHTTIADIVRGDTWPAAEPALRH